MPVAFTKTPVIAVPIVEPPPPPPKLDAIVIVALPTDAIPTELQMIVKFCPQGTVEPETIGPAGVKSQIETILLVPTENPVIFA